MDPEASKSLIERLSQSKIYEDYARAFVETTGLPLSLQPVEAWQLALRSHAKESPFCAIMSKHSRTCAACLEVQDQARSLGKTEPTTVRCFAGLCDTVVPVRLGNEVFGYLQTGQVFPHTPTRNQFARTARQLVEWGLKVDLAQAEEAYFHTRVIGPKQYEAMVRLLGIFAEHLSMVSNQLVVQQDNAEPQMIARAREFIDEHQSEDLSLAEVAKAVNCSTFYFCKMFKKTTGLHFTEYLARVRIEKAKNLLLNPNLRISEIAYEVGFQSLTHFNRVFRRLVGESPTEYRQKLPHP
ncbi:MAG: helix-turn-helix domain-containing protein [Verrucomicrobiales bacterium]|nr:helix-turn-helix domain-containing protein [Verrucomicrobiales bacterium]